MQRRPHDKYFDQGLRGWIVETARKNYWRVAAWYDLDDLIQEGFLAFAVCNAKYRHRVKNKSHFMALVKTVFRNRITDLAAKRSLELYGPKADENSPRIKVELPHNAYGEVDTDSFDRLAGGEQSEAELMASLSKASDSVRVLLAVWADPELAEKMREPQQGKHKETAVDRVYRLTGVRINRDMALVELKALLA